MIPRFKKSRAVIITGCVFGWVGGLNLKIQKTISLDENTAIIAERIPNFSEWVRASLLAYDEGTSERPILKHWLHCDLYPEAHTHQSYNYDRMWKFNGRPCDACMRAYKLGQEHKIGTLRASTTIVEDEA